ncbi:tyrosine-type recombinase/integrase [Streptococcus suis]|uniref:tyrosine-type recombinase/integrase n=1 Tax=Streptococcus suis TaxID=1307 RepID=UPI000422AE93|nr:site-specific integrase [Streptococcus suis]MCG9913057.1 site-specific integrase [Streptococcus suis]MCG9921623.1 site-specific integrase [Streptococcus suis]
MASVRKRGKYYEYRVVYRDSLGERHEATCGGFKTKAQARAAGQEREVELRTSPMSNNDVTLLDYYIAWAELYKKPHVVKKTWNSYEQTRKHISKYFGHIKLKEMSPVRYQEFLNQFGSKYAQDTIERTHYHIKSAVKIAVRDQLIPSNFTEGAVVKSQKEKKPEAESYLEEDEYLYVISKTQENPQYISHMTLYILAVSGMRFAEAMGLTWDDIDFERQVFIVVNTWDYSDSQDFSATKNEQSVREIPFNDNVAKHLLNFKEHYWKENEEGRILFGASNRATNTALKRMVNRDVHPHTLRHTYASYLIFKEVPVASISKLLGHKTILITLKVYAHQFEKMKEKHHAEVRGILADIH